MSERSGGATILDLWFRIFLAGWLTYGPVAFFWTRWAHRKVTWRGPTEGATIALTFDDGPDPVYTPRVLAILAAHNVKATFFVVGDKAAKYPELLRQIVEAGHELGNHTYSHRYSWLVGPWRAQREIDETNRVVAEAVGFRPPYFRPPWGVFNLSNLAYARKQGLIPVLWSLAPGDWSRKVSSQQLVERVLGRVQPGEIILLHDGRGYPGTPDRLLEALPIILASLSRQGYRFVTLSNWIQVKKDEKSAEAAVESF